MHRKTCARWNRRGHAHALTFSCVDRLPLLAAKEAKDLFVHSVAAARRRHRFDVWAYVVMPEHVHLLIRPREDQYPISKILAAIKRPMAYRAKQAGLNARERFWLPGGGFDRNLVGATAVRNEIDYIHANPVRRGLCEAPEDWAYSSAGFWLDVEGVPLEMDRTVPLL